MKPWMFRLIPTKGFGIKQHRPDCVWRGFGTMLIAIIGVLYFKESVTPVKVLWLLLIVVGVVGLNMTRQRQ